MIFVTGDCHSEFRKLSTAAFPEQREMTKDDLHMKAECYVSADTPESVSQFIRK